MTTQTAPGRKTRGWLRSVDWPAVAARYAAGESAKSIAASLGTSRVSVIHRLRSIGAEIRPQGAPDGSKWRKTDASYQKLSLEKAAQVLHLITCGYSYSIIGLKFRISPQRVQQMAKAAGISRRDQSSLATRKSPIPQ